MCCISSVVGIGIAVNYYGIIFNTVYNVEIVDSDSKISDTDSKYDTLTSEPMKLDLATNHMEFKCRFWQSESCCYLFK